MRSKRKQRGWVQFIPLIAAGISAISAERTNRSNEKLAEQNREFQASQTGTAYQRAVADMHAAGLNPMLAYSQGGAQSAGGTTAVMQNSIGQGVGSALQAMQTLREAEQIDATAASAELSRAQADEAKGRTVDAKVTAQIQLANAIEAEERSVKAGHEKRGAQADSLRNLHLLQQELGKTIEGQPIPAGDRDNVFAADVARRRAESKQRQAQAERETLGIPESQAYSDFWQSEFGKAAPYLDRGLDLLKGLSSARQAARPGRTVNVYPRSK